MSTFCLTIDRKLESQIHQNAHDFHSNLEVGYLKYKKKKSEIFVSKSKAL